MLTVDELVFGTKNHVGDFVGEPGCCSSKHKSQNSSNDVSQHQSLSDSSQTRLNSLPGGHFDDSLESTTQSSVSQRDNR